MLSAVFKRGSRTELAKRVDVSRGTINLILQGRRRPSFELALRISAATNGRVSVESLLRGAREDWPMNARIFDGDPVPDAAVQEARRRATEDRLVLAVLEEQFDMAPAQAQRCLADAAEANIDVFVWANEREAEYRRTG